MVLTVMTNPNDTQTAGALRTRKLTTTSADSKWKTFHGHAGLMQYVPSGVFYARAKVDGIVKRASLDTDVFTTAKLKLPDKIKELKKPKATVGTFAEARLLYETDLDNDYTLAEGSRQYRKARIAALLKSWPSLDGMKLEKVPETACRAWAKKFSEQFDEQNFNNTLGTLRGIIERGGIGHDANPAFKIKRLGVKPTVLQLPEPEQFDKLVEAIENAGSGYSHDCADLVRFLAFSGCRISEARKVTWADVDMERGEIKVHNAKRSRTSNAHPTRQVPIIPAMRQLLERLRLEQNPKPTDGVCVVGECEKALTAACGIKNGERLKRTKRGKEILLGIGIERITHHDLRHLFATRCIEAGVDIPTVSRWLGHVDGGALAMKVYGHLRRAHSQQSAQLVTFGAASMPANAIPMPKTAEA
jgi:integrase